MSDFQAVIQTILAELRVQERPRQCACRIDHRTQSVTLHHGGMQIGVRAVAENRVQVTHERALHEAVRVECEIATALLLVEKLLQRNPLGEVPGSR